MVYLLLVIGLVLIYFSLKSDKLTGKKNSFSRVLQNKVDTKDIESIIEEMKYLSDRVENIETSLLLFEEKLNYNNVKEDIYDVDEIINSSVLNTEELEIVHANDELKTIETDPQVIEKTTLNDTLYQLYDEGKTVEEISSITRIGKGEILLRLGLRK
jgi:predicted transcriptional regulator